MKRNEVSSSLATVVLGAVTIALAPAACSESPYDTTAVASQRCPGAQPDQCVAMFGDPRTAGIQASVDPSGPQINAFTPSAYFGDAPFKTDIAFQVTSPVGASLSCELDEEGDGTFEQHVDCAARAVSVAYPVPGRYAPALRVTDSEGRVATASEILLSNRLVVRPETVLVDALPGLVESSTNGDEVTLTFAAESQVPPLDAGAILLDRGVNGYTRKVTALTKIGAQLVAQTEERPVYDAFESGYFGMRNVAAEPLDDAGGQSPPAPKPQDVPGDIKFGPMTTKLHVPLLTQYKLEVLGVELALDDPALDIDFDLSLFEVSVAGRYAFILANSQVHFESDVSVSGAVDLTDGKTSVFLPIGPLGKGFSTPFGKAALGAVVEVGLDAELAVSVEWHQKINAKLNLDLRQTDPLAPDWFKQMLGYPPDTASVWGPPPTFEHSNEKVNLELTGKLFAAPQVVLAVGNASGVMQRAKKTSVKYQAECKKFKGIRAAAGFEANMSFTGSLETDQNGTSRCLRLKRDAKLFAELFPGFEFCPSAELSVLDDADKDIWHKCWPLPSACVNGAQDGDETDVDCGGSCPKCATGKTCNGDADCQSGSCQSGVCAAAGPTCPSGDGLYCGKQDLGQNPAYLYSCENGVYSLASNCNGLGCNVNPPGVDDSCAGCPCAGGTCCSNGCQYDAAGTACGTCKVCNGAGGCNNAPDGSACAGGSCQSGSCQPFCECGGGACCSDGCHHDSSGTSCGTCKVCDGTGSCGDAVDGASCAGGTCQNGACVAGCAAATYWSPSSVSDVDIDGTQYSNGNLIPVPGTQMKIEVSESATPGNLRLRVCKIDAQNPNLINSVHVYFKDLSNVVMFNGTLGTNGTPCSNYGEMSNESNYAAGDVFGGSYRVVSPSGSAAEWTYSCTKSGAADATGTCWWDPGIPTSTRTCK